MAAENAQIRPGDTVAIWACGPVGLFAIKSAILMGAGRVIAIDHHPRRLELARQNGAEVLNFHEVKVPPDRVTGFSEDQQMFMHNKKFHYTVRVAEPNPALASLLLEQFGAPDGVLSAAMRYFSQGLGETDPGRKDR